MSEKIQRTNAEASPSSIADSSSLKSPVEEEKTFHLDVEQPRPLGDTVAAVPKVEALYQVFGVGKASIWLLYISVALAAYALALDGSTTSSYLPLATSAFKQHSALGAITVAEGIISAVGKPFIARISDVTSRPTAYLISVIFYLVGYILIAASSSVGTVAGGTLLTSIGNAGLDVVTDIIVADISPLQWRGTMTALVASPYILNAFIGAYVVQGVLDGPGWRWGYGMFAIIVPVVLAPCVIILYWAQRRAEQMEILSFSASPSERRRVAQGITAKPSYSQPVVEFCTEMDFIGLMVLIAAFSLILLPFTLYRNQGGGWGSPAMIGMEVAGGVTLILFVVWERFGATYPIMPARIAKNRVFLAGVTIDIFYMFSGSLRSTYLSSYIYIVKPWPIAHWSLFLNTLSVALCVFGLLAGLIQRITHRYKLLQIFGICIRIVGLGLMVKQKGVNAGDVEMVWTQILIGMGGAFSVVGTRVATQASVPHADLASVISLLSLWTKLGGSIGSAVAAGVWRNTMPQNLRRELPDVPQATLNTIFGSITTVRAKYPFGSAIRTGVITAYANTTFPLFVGATAVACIPLIAAFAMPNFFLGQTHNVVEGKDLAGKVIDDGRNAEFRPDEGGALQIEGGKKVWWKKLL